MLQGVQETTEVSYSEALALYNLTAVQVSEWQGRVLDVCDISQDSQPDVFMSPPGTASHFMTQNCGDKRT